MPQRARPTKVRKGTAMQAETRELVEIFEYPAGPEHEYPSWDGLAEMPLDAGSEFAGASNAAVGRSSENGAAAQFEQKMAEETRRSFEAGRERGLEEGRSGRARGTCGSLRGRRETARRAGRRADRKLCPGARSVSARGGA